MLCMITKEYWITDFWNLTRSYILELYDNLYYINNPWKVEEDIEKEKINDILKYPWKYTNDEIKKAYLKKFVPVKKMTK